MRILIVKLGSIGDIVHTLPALAAIRRAVPHGEISWVVERRAAAVLQDNPFVDRLIEIDTKALRRWSASGETLLAPRQQLCRLRASAFDAAIDFQGLIKSAFIARLASAPRRYGFTREALREPASRFLLTDQIEVSSRIHVIEKNLALAAGALGIELGTGSQNYEFPVALSRADEREAGAALEQVGEQFAILNPGGGWPTKLWSPERYGALIDALWTNYGLRVIVSYGPGERDLAAAVTSFSRARTGVAVSLSLKGFYALARRAAVYVGGDTGPTHLAVAAGAPVVGLFGPTEWWRNGSPRAEDICVERDDLACRTDCHRRSCSKWLCMDIEVARVAGAVGERLRRVGKFQPALITAHA